MFQTKPAPELELIGVPTSAASYAPGQEKAHQALRDAGLIEAIKDAGIRVFDRGDLPVQRWQPDRTNRFLMQSLRNGAFAPPPRRGFEPKGSVMRPSRLTTRGFSSLCPQHLDWICRTKFGIPLGHSGAINSINRCATRCGETPKTALHRYAQNLTDVTDYVVQTRELVRQAIAANRIPLILGGNCTLEIDTVAGHLPSEKRIGLIYLDLHADLNTPDSTTNGVLDWMGVAHMLNLEGARSQLTQCGSQTPLLSPNDVVFFGFDPSNATDWELKQIKQLNLRVVTCDEAASDPVGKANQILNEWGKNYDRLLIHFDVDVIDFVDLPLSENHDRNVGLSFEHTMQALTAFVKDERFGALTIAELNPDHGNEDGSTVQRFVRALVKALSYSRLNSKAIYAHQ